MMTPHTPPWLRLDPRWYQIVVLSALLLYGLTALRFDVDLRQVALMLGVVLLTQWACTRLWHLPAFDPKSALISGLSLCLLLRTNHLWLAALGAGIAVASKFVFRVRGKHILNPTNGALVILMMLGAPVWVSPGQWGNVAFFGFLMACLGGLVVNRAARSDVAFAFVAFYLAIVFGRALWLGQRMEIPLHQLQSGALLLFTFFMISDPRTTPDSRSGRVLFALLVAIGAAFVPFVLHRTNGLLWSLAACSLFVPLIDRVLPGARHTWSSARPEFRSKGARRETLPLDPHRLPAGGALATPRA